jgi:ribosomal protein L12E/L44/L45/RPP1/RPP2
MDPSGNFLVNWSYNKNAKKEEKRRKEKREEDEKEERKERNLLVWLFSLSFH